jgi:uncharacterized membrane protein
MPKGAKFDVFRVKNAKVVMSTGLNMHGTIKSNQKKAAKLKVRCGSRVLARLRGRKWSPWWWVVVVVVMLVVVFTLLLVEEEEKEGVWRKRSVVLRLLVVVVVVVVLLLLFECTTSPIRWFAIVLVSFASATSSDALHLLLLHSLPALCTIGSQRKGRTRTPGQDRLQTPTDQVQPLTAGLGRS